MKTKKQYQYPWRADNKFQVLIDGHVYFPSMLDAISQAKRQILLEIYLFESGNIARQFIEALCAAKSRGANIYLLLDDYGAKNLSPFDKHTLTKTGINLQLYNPVTIRKIGTSLKRDHRKILIIDNKTAFIGGAGITDEFNPDKNLYYWHDVMLRAEGKVVQDLADSFNKTWIAHQLPAGEQVPEIIPHQSNIISESKARILIGDGTDHNEINRAIVTHIRSAKKHVWVTSPYFISSWKIRRALRYAAKKGVDVRLILPGTHSDHKWVTFAMHRYYARLIRANIKIYEFQPRFTHSKIILCDDWFTIGSSNLDVWNQYLNLDANIEIYDHAALTEIKKLFELNFKISKIVSAEEWSTRSFIQRLKEWGSGVVISVLGYISRKFRR